MSIVTFLCCPLVECLIHIWVILYRENSSSYNAQALTSIKYLKLSDLLMYLAILSGILAIAAFVALHYINKRIVHNRGRKTRPRKRGSRSSFFRAPVRKYYDLDQSNVFTIFDGVDSTYYCNRNSRALAFQRSFSFESHDFLESSPTTSML